MKKKDVYNSFDEELMILVPSKKTETQYIPTEKLAIRLGTTAL